MYAERSVPSRCICNSLAQTLTVFLGTVLAKRYTNPSADIISVLAGLDEVDAVFLDFANALEGILRQGRSCEHRRLFFSDDADDCLQSRFVKKLQGLLYHWSQEHIKQASFLTLPTVISSQL